MLASFKEFIQEEPERSKADKAKTMQDVKTINKYFKSSAYKKLSQERLRDLADEKEIK